MIHRERPGMAMSLDVKHQTHPRWKDPTRRNKVTTWWEYMM